jgi:hypothetical protein
MSVAHRTAITAIVGASLATPGLGALTHPWRADAQAALAAEVPTDLRPLLLPKKSELRLVALRYALDRQTLDSNYAGSFDRLGLAANDPLRTGDRPPLSRARLARLKEFDQNWDAALVRLDASKLTAAARADLDALRRTIAANQRALETDTAGRADGHRPSISSGSRSCHWRLSRLLSTVAGRAPHPRLPVAQPERANGLPVHSSREPAPARTCGHRVAAESSAQD